MNPKRELDGNMENELKGWELINFISTSMNSFNNNPSNINADFFKDKLVRSLKDQNIDIENIDVATLRKASLKILTESLAQELLEK